MKKSLPTNDDITNERLQNALVLLRRLRGWTMQDLANRIGVTKQTISNMEHGKIQLTRSWYILIRMAFQSSLYELTDSDAKRFSYSLETMLDPQSDVKFIDNLKRGFVLGLALSETDKSVDVLDIINDMMPGTIDAVSTHHIKYTGDPNGLDWYYDLVGIDRNKVAMAGSNLVLHTSS